MKSTFIIMMSIIDMSTMADDNNWNSRLYRLLYANYQIDEQTIVDCVMNAKKPPPSANEHVNRRYGRGDAAIDLDIAAGSEC